MSSSNKIIVICGGTGGHFYPGLSVARHHVAKGGEAMLMLGGKHAEGQAELAAEKGLGSVIIPAPKQPGSVTAVPAFGFGLLKGVLAARRVIRGFRPTAVLAMGGFASMPGVLAAKTAGVPIYLHEGNTVVGKANRTLSIFAERAALSFPAVNAGAMRCPTIETGMPVRPELLTAAIARDDAVEKLNEEFGVKLDSSRKIVLIFGGSQGAAIFNRELPEIVSKLNCQVIHLAGPGNAEETRNNYGDELDGLVIDKYEDMATAYAAADLVVCRSGAATLAELALFAKPAVLIPLAIAAEQHQARNAELFQKAGAAEILFEDQCSAENIAKAVSSYLNDDEKTADSAAKAAGLARPKATLAVLEMICDKKGKVDRD